MALRPIPLATGNLPGPWAGQRAVLHPFPSAALVKILFGQMGQELLLGQVHGAAQGSGDGEASIPLFPTLSEALEDIFLVFFMPAHLAPAEQESTMGFALSDMTLRSPAFAEGGAIPRDHTGRVEHVPSPQLGSSPRERSSWR